MSLVFVGGLAASAGCNPYTTVAKIGIKVVGDVVNDVDTSEKSQQLIGQPASMADAGFGQRIRTLQEVDTPREMIVYPVKDDLLNVFRWAVETENGRIVAVSKLQTNPDGGKDIAEKLLLEAIVLNKPLSEVQSHRYFERVVLVLRDPATSETIRAYDVSLIPDFMGAKYCVLQFDSAEVCRKLWMVGVPAASGGSRIGN